jgi:type IV pilus assembly protein PilM
VPLFGKNKMSLLGVDISSTSIKVLALGGNEQRYRVESYAVDPSPVTPSRSEI